MKLSGNTPKQISPPPVSKRLVYVVDDQIALTDLYQMVLEEAGYEVKTFTDRVKALTGFLSADPQPALLITDWEGGPISAEELIHSCRTAQPKLKVLMVSGYAESWLNLWNVKPDRFVEKPLAIESLVGEVQSLIGRSENKASANDHVKRPRSLRTSSRGGVMRLEAYN